MCTGATSERFHRAQDKPRNPNGKTQTVHLSANYQGTNAEPIDKEKLRLHPASLYPDITHRVVMELNNKLINAAWFFAFITFSIIREMLCCLYLFLCFCFTILSWKKKPTKTHINNLRKKPLLIGSWHRRYNIEI